MLTSRKPTSEPLFYLLLAVLIGLVFLQSPGTTDVDIWRSWVNHAISRGLVPGYAANQADYPPLSLAVLSGAYRFFQVFDIPLFGAIKRSIFLGLILTAALFWGWTRNLKISLLLYFALLLNSVALGYIDIFFAPSLVLALWMLKAGRYGWFSLFYAIAVLTKWQPIIIAPFLALYLFAVLEIKPLRLAALKRLLVVGLPAAVVTGLVLAIFGARPVWLAFQASLSHQYLSGNALNFNWVLTHFLHLLNPAEYGGLQHGLATYIITDAPQVALFPRLLFAATYLIALLVFIRREKSFTNLIAFSILGFLAYFTFNPGVHENHLFLVTILAVVLYWLDPAFRGTAVILIGMSNINLFVFYGVDGTLHFERLAGTIDIALPLALFNVGFFLDLFWRMVTRRAPTQQPAAGATSRQPVEPAGENLETGAG